MKGLEDFNISLLAERAVIVHDPKTLPTEKIIETWVPDPVVILVLTFIVSRIVDSTLGYCLHRRTLQGQSHC